MVPSMSLSPLKDGEYDDGEVYRIDFTRGIGQAIAEEEWLNVPAEHQRYWLAVMRSSRCRFIGTVISRVRGQVELTIIFREATSGTVNFCITLDNMDRFY